jgi:hypothetical protein
MIPLSHEHQYSRTHIYPVGERKVRDLFHVALNRILNISFQKVPFMKSRSKTPATILIHSNHIYGNLIRVVLLDEGTCPVERVLHLHGSCTHSYTLLITLEIS